MMYLWSPSVVVGREMLPFYLLTVVVEDERTSFVRFDTSLVFCRCLCERSRLLRPGLPLAVRSVSAPWVSVVRRLQVSRENGGTPPSL